jgi:uncharacterized protein (DUF1697 family)
MVTYVAFLRGINVGGNNIIKMADLRDALTQAGFQWVKTYIQSGNVIFQSEIAQKNIIEKNLEKLLSGTFHYTARVLVRSKKDMQDTVNHLPKIFENTERKHNIIFLSDQINSRDILTKFEIKKEIEEISYRPWVLFWSAKMDTITRSNMLKLSTRKEYQEMTVRNINTTKKIMELMNI